MLKLKDKADGICGVCGGKVPSSNLNKFYCSEPCRIEAWKFHHPEEQEPDWDNLPEEYYF